jgi:hypothetical protein
LVFKFDLGPHPQHCDIPQFEFLPGGIRPAGYPQEFHDGSLRTDDKDELFADQPDVEQRIDTLHGSTFRIGAYTLGYTRDIDLFRHVETGIGANFTATRFQMRSSRITATIPSAATFSFVFGSGANSGLEPMYSKGKRRNCNA